MISLSFLLNAPCTHRVVCTQLSGYPLYGKRRQARRRIMNKRRFWLGKSCTLYIPLRVVRNSLVVCASANPNLRVIVMCGWSQRGAPSRDQHHVVVGGTIKAAGAVGSVCRRRQRKTVREISKRNEPPMKMNYSMYMRCENVGNSLNPKIFT